MAGHAVEAVDESRKFVAIEGFWPEDGMGRISGVLPMFESTAVWGLSLLVVP